MNHILKSRIPRALTRCTLLCVVMMLAGCAGTVVRTVTWWDESVNVLIVMHEDGQCDVVYDGIRVLPRPTYEFEYIQDTKWDGTEDRRIRLECYSDSPLYDGFKVKVATEFSSDHIPYVDALGPSSSTELLQIDMFVDIDMLRNPEHRAAQHFFRVYGSRVGESAFCPIRFKFDSLAFIGNAGINSDMHILVGSGKRVCGSWINGI